jgi:sulfite oxidase
MTDPRSWDIVKKEKSEDMIHVLQFPYNGEPPRVILTPIKNLTSMN